MWSSFPLVRIFLAFTIGLWIHSVFPDLSVILAAGSTVLFSMGYLTFRKVIWRKRQVYTLGILVIFFVLGSARGEIQQYSERDSPLPDLDHAHWMGAVQSDLTTTEKWHRCEVSCLNTETRDQKWMVYLPNHGNQKPELFDTLFFNGTPKPVHNDGNPFEFDQENYYATKNIDHILFARSYQLIPFNGNKTNGSWRNVFRSWIWDRLQALDQPHFQILMYAMMTGDKQELPKEVRNQFVQSGIIHVLAVSGMHIGLLAAIPMYILKRRKQKNGFRLALVILSICLIWIYAFLVGGSPSVTRSSIMFSLFLIADHQRKRSHSINLLCASALIILIMAPSDLFSLSFQLSHLAVLGIVLGVRKLSTWYLPSTRVFRPVIQMAYISISAQLATSPIILFHFNSFPTYFLVANLLIVPLLIGALYLTLIGLLLFKVPIFSEVISWLISRILDSCLWGVARITELPSSSLEISNIEWPHVIAAYAALGILLFWRKGQGKKVIIRLLIVTLGVVVLGMIPQREIVVFAGTRYPILALREHQKVCFIGDSSKVYPGIHQGYTQHRSSTKPRWQMWENVTRRAEGLIQQEAGMVLFGKYWIDQKGSDQNWEVIIDKVNLRSLNVQKDTMIWDLDQNGAFSLKEFVLPNNCLLLHSHTFPIRIVHKRD